MVRKSVKIAALVLILLVWFGHIQYRDLFQPDEGRYAEIPREMVVSGNWLTPRLDGFKYFEKPPLQYWTTAAAYELFGQHNWTARLWSYLTGFGGILLVWVAGGILFGGPAGLYAALVLASCLFYGAVGHINNLDVGLTFFMSATLVGFLLSLRESATDRGRRFWMLFAWASAALAMLTKGLEGIVLPGGAFIFYSLWQRDWKLWGRLRWGEGLALFSAITLPWFVLMARENPKFLWFFFVHEHFERYLTKIHHHFQPWWYFLPLLLAGALPWLSGAIRALLRGWRSSEPPGRFDSGRFLWVWVVTILVFFSFSDSKLIPYILPIFPALAMLIGRELARSPRGLGWDALVSGVLAAAGLVFALGGGFRRLGHASIPAALYVAAAPWFAVGFGFLLIGALVAWLRLRRGATGWTIGALALSWLFAVNLWLCGFQALAPSYSAHSLARQVRPYLSAGVPLYGVGTYDQTLPFYLSRLMTVVAYKGELAFGIDRDPQGWIPDIHQFVQRWRKDRSALAVMSPKTYAELQKRDLPMREIGRDPRRVMVMKP
jgi:hypothetical protein